MNSGSPQATVDADPIQVRYAQPQPWTPDELVRLIRRPPAIRDIRVVAIDGYSGAGKTELAARLAERTSATVVHLDDLYPGWDGLAAAVPLVRDWILEPLAHGAQPEWGHYDWATGDYAGTRTVEVSELLIIEGCGAGARDLAPYCSTLIWVEASPEIRDHRLTKRADWPIYQPYRPTWAAQESAFFAAHDPRSRADLIVDASPR